MIIVPPDPISVVVAPGRRSALSRWRSAVDDLFPPLRVVTEARDFGGAIRSAGAPGLQLTDISASPHVVVRDCDGRSAGPDGFYKLSLQLAGEGRMRQGGRELALRPGSIAMYDTARSYELSFDTDCRLLVAMFPRSALALPAGVANELAAVPLQETEGVGDVFAAYARSMNDNLALLAGAAGRRTAQIFLDLAAVFLGEQLSAGLAGDDAGRTALLMRILRHIDDHISDPDLDPTGIAAAHFISTRQLYNVFAPTGETVAQWIRRRRLAGARDDLVQPSQRDATVTEIARRWGFADSAYFGRVFRETYGTTPGRWRAEAR
ncbi:helix-turn-helix domain-containing protein [Microbacterium betulae]|uniref:Helix-turn-helix domain-containing protein n=1 Tax=Microbacterium betulae TaxID=2981139 RepID=A0AA97FIQ6_9MICO|nr:helix-turn-helix domain-containing protein [Microbacterium sp. AB]WOF23936.1 helix-turn-helix domain-containing protein [Microbacterium sp. AB]